MSTIKDKKAKIINQQPVWYSVAILFIIITTSAVIRFCVIDVPLERDEGEYAYAGQLILDGIAPYSQVYNMKLPGIYAAYALILAAFGQTHNGVHFGLIIVNSATILVLFLLIRKIFGPVAGLTGAGAFAVLSLSSSVQGIFANAEHFVILPACTGLLMIVYAKERQNIWMLFIGGLLLGLGFLMKQHGAAFTAFGAIYLFCSSLNNKVPLKQPILKCILFVVSSLLPFIIACIILSWAGVFKKFWFWTFEYASQYVSSVPFSTGIKTFNSNFEKLVYSSWAIWLLSLIGFLCLILNRKTRSRQWFALGFAFFSFLAVCPGFYFRPHYFVLLLPAVAMFAGVAAASFWGFFDKNQFYITKKIILLILILMALGQGIYSQQGYLFGQSPNTISRMVYGINPFPESLKIAKYIKENSNQESRIAVLGSEPQIYFYSNRRSATGYIYTYALMKNHPYAVKMQNEMIAEIESINPEFMVVVNIETSWLCRKDSNKMIFTWLDNYAKNYECTGVVDILNANQTTYVWGNRAQTYLPHSSAWLKIYRKKNL